MPTPCTMIRLLGYFKPINQWEENSHPLSPDLSPLDFFLWVKGNQFLLSGEYLKLKIEVQEHTLKPYLLEPSILHNWKLICFEGANMFQNCLYCQKIGTNGCKITNYWSLVVVGSNTVKRVNLSLCINFLGQLVN